MNDSIAILEDNFGLRAIPGGPFLTHGMPVPLVQYERQPSPRDILDRGLVARRRTRTWKIVELEKAARMLVSFYNLEG